MVDFPTISGLNTPPVRTTNRSSAETNTQKRRDRDRLRPPGRARLNIIPTNELISDLVEKALIALRKGIHWDRGSIVNIVL